MPCNDVLDPKRASKTVRSDSHTAVTTGPSNHSQLVAFVKPHFCRFWGLLPVVLEWDVGRYDGLHTRDRKVI